MISMLKTMQKWFPLQGIPCRWLMETWVKVSFVFWETEEISKPFHVVASHSLVRGSVGLFDVGHMVQSKSAFYP